MHYDLFGVKSPSTGPQPALHPGAIIDTSVLSKLQSKLHPALPGHIEIEGKRTHKKQKFHPKTGLFGPFSVTKIAIYYLLALNSSENEAKRRKATPGFPGWLFQQNRVVWNAILTEKRYRPPPTRRRSPRSARPERPGPPGKRPGRGKATRGRSPVRPRARAGRGPGRRCCR